MSYDHWKTTNPADEELGTKEQNGCLLIPTAEEEVGQTRQSTIEEPTTQDKPAAHTPGPWHAVPAHPQSNAYFVICALEQRMHASHAPVAVIMRDLRRPIAEAEASARLIAAAPEYYALSKALVAHFREVIELYGEKSPMTAGMASLAAQAMRLNLKAEGRE